MNTLSLPRWPVEVDGVTYEAETAVCEEFRLCVEDHGLFTALISFAGNSWGQGLPARGLDAYDIDTDKRVGTAFGCDFIMESVRVLGSPEQAKGRRVVVLRLGHFIEGFAALHDDGTIGEPFIPRALAAKHFGADDRG